jgi:hypothetical protein
MTICKDCSHSTNVRPIRSKPDETECVCGIDGYIRYYEREVDRSSENPCHCKFSPKIPRILHYDLKDPMGL